MTEISFAIGASNSNVGTKQIVEQAIGVFIFKSSEKKMIAAQAADTDPFRCNFTNMQNPPIQENIYAQRISYKKSFGNMITCKTYLTQY